MLTNKIVSIIGFTLVFMLAVLTLNCAAPQSSQSSEEEIWELEEAYVANHNDANHGAILAAYHEDFLGWPETSPSPARKMDMPESLQQNFPEPSDDVVEIERKGIQVKDNIALTHYTVHVTTTGEEGEAIERSLRITHTWIREADQWQILGGMSDE